MNHLEHIWLWFWDEGWKWGFPGISSARRSIAEWQCSRASISRSQKIKRTSWLSRAIHWRTYRRAQPTFSKYVGSKIRTFARYVNPIHDLEDYRSHKQFLDGLYVSERGNIEEAWAKIAEGNYQYWITYWVTGQTPKYLCLSMSFECSKT